MDDDSRGELARRLNGGLEAECDAFEEGVGAESQNENDGRGFTHSGSQLGLVHLNLHVGIFLGLEALLGVLHHVEGLGVILGVKVDHLVVLPAWARHRTDEHDRP